jgi:hypothetical protein
MLVIGAPWVSTLHVLHFPGCRLAGRPIYRLRRCENETVPGTGQHDDLPEEPDPQVSAGRRAEGCRRQGQISWTRPLIAMYAPSITAV